MPINACGLQAAESNRAVLRYIAEDPACWGATPATGNTREMRITKSTLTSTKATVISNELRADRMIPDVIEVARMSGGEVDFEFSAGSLDDFMQAFLLGAWTRTMGFDKFSGLAVSVGTTSRVDIAGGDFRIYYAVGQRVKLEGFTNPANNDYFQINSMAFVGGATQLTMTTSTLVVEAANSLGTIFDANDVIILKNTTIRAGTAAAQAFDSNGGNAFSAAISAKQLVVGQKIFVDFKPGYEVGSFVILGTKGAGTVAFAATAAATDTVTVNDGVNPVFTFTFVASGAVLGSGNVNIGVSATASADNLKAEINQQTTLLALDVTASGAGSPVTVTNNKYLAVTLAAPINGGANTTVTNNTVAAVASAVDGDTVTVKDGVNSAIFEFDSNGSFTRGNVGVTLSLTSKTVTAANLQAAIMDQLRKRKIRVSASVSSATVTVRNLEKDQIANAALTSLSDSTAAITTTDFAGGLANFGFFTITALTNDVITVAEPVATSANGGSAAITIKGSHLRNPGALTDIHAQSFSIETGFTDKGHYFLQDGLRVGGFTLAVDAGALVNGKCTFMGKETKVAETSTLGNSPYNVLASTATPILNATVNVGNIYKNGVLLATALQKIELAGTAALRDQKAVGSTFPAGIGTGRFELKGKITSYFETLEMYDHFLQHDTVSLAFDFIDGDKNAYWFTIPALKIISDPIAPGGIDQDVLEALDFVSLRDPNLNTQFMVDRFSSTTPATA